MHDCATGLLADLFGSMAHVMFCIKDVDGRYVAANDAFVGRVGATSADEVIGRLAADLFRADLAASYDAQDAALLATGVAVRNQLEIITDAGGRVAWYLTTKVPYRAEGDRGGAGEVTGIVVVSVAAPLAGRDGDGLAAAIDLARARFAEPLRVEDLATVAGMTVDQLERSMRRALSVSPKKYLLRTRLDHAATLLSTTDLTVAEVAVRCGYYDQSQLSRQFRAAVGTTPGRYRLGLRAS